VPRYYIDFDFGLTLVDNYAEHEAAAPPIVFLPNQIEIESTPQDDLPCNLRVTVRPVGGRFEAVDTLVTQKPNGVPISRSVLVDLPISEWVGGCAAYIKVFREGKTMEAMQGIDLDQYFNRIREGRPNDSALKDLASAYRILYALNKNPGKEIQDRLPGINRTTITRWLSKAEKLGYLDPQERGREKRPGRGGRSAESIQRLLEGHRLTSRLDLPRDKQDPARQLVRWAKQVAKSTENHQSDEQPYTAGNLIEETHHDGPSKTD
jgi:hypothetical protein